MSPPRVQPEPAVERPCRATGFLIGRVCHTPQQHGGRGDAHPSALPGGAPSPVERRNEAEIPDGDVANNASGSLTGVLITTTADMFCFVPLNRSGSQAGKARLARGSRSCCCCWREIIEYAAQTRLAHPPPRAERVQKAAAIAPSPPGHPPSSSCARFLDQISLRPAADSSASMQEVSARNKWRCHGSLPP